MGCTFFLSLELAKLLPLLCSLTHVCQLNSRDFLLHSSKEFILIWPFSFDSGCLPLACTNMGMCFLFLSLSLSLSLLPLSDLENSAVWVLLTTTSSSILLASFVFLKTNQTVAKTGKNFVLAKFVVVATNSQLVPFRESNAMQYQLDGKKGVIID